MSFLLMLKRQQCFINMLWPEGVPAISEENLPTVCPASLILSGNMNSRSLQISSASEIAESSLHLSPSAVEVSVESNTSEGGPLHARMWIPVMNITTNEHQERHIANFPRTVDACHFPTQVSDADVDVADPEEAPSTLRHTGNVGQIQLHNPQHEGSDPVVISDPDEENCPMQLDTEWASAFPCDEPQHPDMRNFSFRLESFHAFWTDGIVGNLAEIAQAGFYCYGQWRYISQTGPFFILILFIDINRARCWYCGFGGHEWSPNENPWEVHAKLRPK